MMRKKQRNHPDWDIERCGEIVEDEEVETERGHITYHFSSSRLVGLHPYSKHSGKL